MVVGGGPVGLLVAAELAGRGVGVLVLESREAASERPKATTLHARTAQSLARRGYRLGERGHGSGGPVGAEFHFAGMPGLNITVPSTEPGPIVKIEQSEVERLFAERARATGVRVLRGHQVTRVVQEGDMVRVAARRADGSSATFTSGYLVGADGARSTVREQQRIESDTWDATVSALMGRVRLRDPGAVLPGWHRTARGWVAVKDLLDGRVHLRTLSDRPCGGDRHTPPTVEELSQEVSWITGREVAMEEPQWLSRFSDFSRLVRTYRAGRVFLAGDAAHVHFPIGGQGLSTGLLDAVNLGWKLAHAVQDTAGPGLLDSYDEERRPAARRVIDNTQAQVALMRVDPALAPLQELLGGMLASGTGSEYLGPLISAQDTVLPGRLPGGAGSPWEGRFLENIALVTEDGPTEVIDLLQEGRFLLLLAGGGDAAERYVREAGPWARELRVVRVPASGPEAGPGPGQEPGQELGAAASGEGLPCESLLVRPDGYIAWEPGAGCLREALSVYLGAARHPVEPEPAGYR